MAEEPVAAFKDLCADAADAGGLARFWAAVLGQPSGVRGDGVAHVDPAPGQPSSRRIWVNPVPEPSTDSRVHLAFGCPPPTPPR